MISDTQYIKWNEKLKQKSFFSRFFIFWGIYSVLYFGFISLYFLTQKNGWQIVFIATIAATFGHFILCKLVHFFYPQQHPYQRLNFIPPVSILFSFIDRVKDSFPSEHSAGAMAITVIFFYFNFWIGVISIIVTILIGAARVVLGYHYISDVLGGFITGAMSACLALYVLMPILFTK